MGTRRRGVAVEFLSIGVVSSSIINSYGSSVFVSIIGVRSSFFVPIGISGSTSSTDSGSFNVCIRVNFETEYNKAVPVD